MPLSAYERQVLLLKLHVQMVPDDAPNMTMREVFEILREVFLSGNAHLRTGNQILDDDENPPENEQETNDIRITGFEVRVDDTIAILLQYGDSDAPDPALLNMVSGQLRTAGKTNDEAIAHSAHFIVSPNSEVTGQTKGLLERVPNLGRSNTISFFNKLIRLYAKENDFRYEEEETRRSKSCHPKLVASQQLSKSLRSDLENGKLSRIEFITHDIEEGFEEANRVVPVTRTLVHKVVAPPSGTDIFALLERAKFWARQHHYEEMQIRFKKASTSQSLSPRFSTELADAEDAVYSRLEIIDGFTDKLPQCPQNFVDEIVQKMLVLFGRTILWQ